MRVVIALSLVFLCFGCSARAGGHKPVPDEVRKPVLVELFTSEGCSSCPPAEALLAKLEREQPFDKAELITLAFHVDYWDSLGWKDKFASPLFTQRQKFYDRKFQTGRIYTPQMVVDGEFEFIGSRENEANKAFGKAIKADKASITAEIVDGAVKIAIDGLEDHEKSTVYMAIAEDGLSSDIRRGENAGKNLSHLSVVRRLVGIGMIPAGTASYRGSVKPQLDPEWITGNLKIVLFVQENKSRNVLAVDQTTFN